MTRSKSSKLRVKQTNYGFAEKVHLADIEGKTLCGRVSSSSKTDEVIKVTCQACLMYFTAKGI